MRKLIIKNNNLILTDDILTIFEKKVTKFGTGAKIDCPLKFLGKSAYIIIRK